MKNAKFIVEGTIQTKARPRATIIAGHPTVYTPKTTLYYENYVKCCYKEQCGKINFEDKPMKVIMHFNFIPNKDLLKLIKETNTEIDQVECTNHKDVDNLAKIILDALNGLAFKDDKNIVKLKVSKHYTEEECESVSVEIQERYTLSMEDLRTKKRVKTLQDKISTISAKEKITKSDTAKLDKYNQELKELTNDY